MPKPTVKNKYRSKFEKTVYEMITDMGFYPEYEPHRIHLILPMKGECAKCGAKEVGKSIRYTPDFWVETRNFYIEAKGIFTHKDRQIAEAMVRDKRGFGLVFMRDNKIHKLSTTRYSDWCRRHGVKYAINEVPKEWLK